jgi:hypothetical protein
VSCYHCGSTVGAEVDLDKVDSDQFSLVLPMCKCCRDKGKKVKTTTPAKTADKQCAAPSGKKRGAKAAQILEADRAAKKKAVPERDQGMDVIEGVVGKMVQGGKKFLFWGKKDGGGEYPKDQCTWQATDEAVSPDVVLGQRASLKLGQSVFKGVILRAHESQVSTYFVRFDNGRHSDRYVDLELPIKVAAGGYSWWRLDGYDTCDEEE